MLRELLLVIGLFLVYKFGRQLAIGHTATAFRNADRVWDFERAVRLPGEGAVQSLLLHDHTVVQLANAYYATVHFPATVLFLIWLYLRRPVHYLWARRVLAAVTSVALVLPFAFPLAPPRMLSASGLQDTARLYGPSVYGPPTADHLSNQYAAMPSLHFGWALMVAIGLIAATRSRWRWLWLLHPLVTLTVIVGTANHYWLDSIAATLMFLLAFALVPGPARTTPSAAVHRCPTVRIPRQAGPTPGERMSGERVLGERVLGERVLGERVLGERAPDGPQRP
ncbi:phosphatase PAP2 family protein [Kitasatospora sp. NA04385]|uniref:phosphatase PAP2 family protein n=1 Tax=Kitasatospora sp. NA04385 TaxID=2742135 RepID=UPI0020CB4F36|nr:phosphatase PAP2 family protein [Kitasatospora sp. NA04385]